MSKKIKVQLTSKKSAYVIERQIYRPGDIFEIDETRFNVSCMVKVAEPKKTVEPPKEVAEEPEESVDLVEEEILASADESEDEVVSEAVMARTAPKVRKRRV